MGFDSPSGTVFPGDTTNSARRAIRIAVETAESQ